MELTLDWDSPFYTASGVSTSLSIYIVNTATNTVVASSTTDATSTQMPYQFVAAQNTTASTANYAVVIQLAKGPAPGALKYVNYGSERVRRRHVPVRNQQPDDQPTRGRGRRDGRCRGALLRPDDPGVLHVGRPGADLLRRQRNPARLAADAGQSPTSCRSTGPTTRSWAPTTLRTRLPQLLRDLGGDPARRGRRRAHAPGQSEPDTRAALRPDEGDRDPGLGQRQRRRCGAGRRLQGRLQRTSARHAPRLRRLRDGRRDAALVDLQDRGWRRRGHHRRQPGERQLPARVPVLAQRVRATPRSTRRPSTSTPRAART